MIASNAIAGPADPKNVFAKMESPFFKASQHPVECISFWFYLGPDGRGETLTVGIQNNKNEDLKVIWVLDEKWTDEAKWNKGRVEVKPDKTDEDYEFKVVVIANKGSNNQSFVVFDEVVFVGTDKCEFEPAAAKPTEAPTTTTQGPTTPTTLAPTEPPGPVIVCNFEENLCGWQIKPDNATFVFQRHNAIQIGDKPGPNNDYQGKDDKFFMIASQEKDAGNQNQIARFRSPKFKKDEHPVECFSFWFNFGLQGQGEYLTVSVEHDGEDPKIIWSLDQNWNNEQKWHEGRIEVTPIEAAEKPEYRIVFETPKGQNDQSFLAVDQFVFLQESSCGIMPAQAAPTPPPTEPPLPVIECSFEQNICDWKVITNDDDGNYRWVRKKPTQLSNNGIPGPEQDFDGNNDRFFMIASNAMAPAGDPKITFTRLESAFFKSKEHQTECLKFWFYFGVRN